MAGRRITAIVGSYRKGGIVDQAVDEVVDAARAEGAEVVKIYLADTSLEFCTNCRACTQEPGRGRGPCPIDDEMSALLDRLEASDAIVLASPVNFGGETALMKLFIERLLCYAYWPWGSSGPALREERPTRRAVLVASSAAPGILTRLLTPVGKHLQKAATLLGARTVGTLIIGFAAKEKRQRLPEYARKKARLLGKKLVVGM